MKRVWTTILGLFLLLACPLLSGCDGGGADCGNGKVEGDEACDGSDLNARTCTSFGFTGGDLACNDDCTFDTSGCTADTLCGNDQLDFGEYCDGDLLNGKDCTDLGFHSGVLACKDDCTFDLSGCRGADPCGNGQLDPNEDCDDDLFGDKTCADYGFDEGDLACNSDCSINTSGCRHVDPCGNGELDVGEDCDGNPVEHESCEGLGFASGELVCDGDCHYDTSGCISCGNGRLDPDEDCDGNPVTHQSCEGLGFASGTLACDGECHFDTIDCEGEDPCGNGEIDAGEDCDGENLDDKDCRSLGFIGGALDCHDDCSFDTSDCIENPCGNGQIDTGEDCDGNPVTHASCTDLGFAEGELACTPSCSYDTSGCAGCLDDALEENDALIDAAPLGAGSHALRFCGQLAEEEDWFAVDLLSGQLLLVVMRFVHARLDLDLWLYDAQEQQLDSSLSYEDRESVHFTAGADQTVYVKVDSSRLGDADYDLSVLLDPDCVIDDECGAGEICTDGVCEIGCREDEDCQGEGEICFQSTCIVPECTQHRDCSPGQICIDYACQDFSCSDDVDCPDGLRCDQAGACVECLSPADCPDETVFDCIDALCVLDCAEDSYEPNSSPDMAADVAAPLTEPDLTLCGQRDEDWFRLDLLASERYSFDFTFLHADGDIDAYLYTAGDLLSSVVRGASTTDDESFSYAVPADGGGTYYVRVRLYSSDVYTQTYDLAIADVGPIECFDHFDCTPGQICEDYACVDFTCDANHTCPDGLVCDSGTCVECISPADCPDETAFTCEASRCVLDCIEDAFEPNSSAADAVVLGLPATEADLTLCGQRDEDWFQIELDELTRYGFDFLFTHADGDIDAYLYAAGDTSTALARGYSSTDDEFFAYPVPAGQGGTYLVRVRLFSTGVWRQSYDMAISAQGVVDCFEDADCTGAGELCIDNACIVPECQTDADCQPDQACRDYACVARPTGDVCADPILATELPFAVTGFDIDPFNPDLEWADRTCTGYGTRGKDVIFRVDLTSGETVTATASGSYDLSLYITADCSTSPMPVSACLDGSDSFSEETVSYQASTDETVYVVVDYFLDGPTSGTFDLSIDSGL
ncbi:MAG: PPC domain-containing protein [Deltaproteobacteria bacterium]|nr:PPC domain-containing protein [Deltaproteobacteria bacterium]